MASIEILQNNQVITSNSMAPANVAYAVASDNTATVADSMINSIAQCAPPGVFTAMSKDINTLKNMLTVSPGYQTWLSTTVFCIVNNLVKLSAEFNLMCVINNIGNQDGSYGSGSYGSNCDIVQNGVDGVFGYTTKYDTELNMLNNVLAIYKVPLQILADFVMDTNDFFIQECSKTRNLAGKAKLALLDSILKNIRYILRLNMTYTKQPCSNSTEFKTLPIPLAETNLIGGVDIDFSTIISGYAEFAQCVGAAVAYEFVFHFIYVSMVLETQNSGSGSGEAELLLGGLINNSDKLLYPITRISLILDVIDKVCMMKFIYAMESSGSSGGSGIRPIQQVCQMYTAVIGTDSISDDNLGSMVFADQILKKYGSVLRNVVVTIKNDAVKMVESNICNLQTNTRISSIVTLIDSLRDVLQGTGVVVESLVTATSIEGFNNTSGSGISSNRGTSSNMYLILAIIIVITIIYFMGGFN
jgi:hypothetical protein